MKTLAVLSGKGGTGKSAITASFGYLLGHLGFKTLLVDLDIFTHGLTYYGLPGVKEIRGLTLSDVFLSGEKGAISCLPVSHPFAQSNLYILPSINPGKKPDQDIHFLEEVCTITGFRNRLKELIRYAVNRHGFEYVIIDTRGGTDHTSTAAALCADAFVMVSEADKPSWDMGGFLLSSIDRMETRENLQTMRAGFIINKNVLPEKEIADYLKKKWQIPCLGSIAYDPFTVQCFQEDKVPVGEDPGAGFSRSVILISRRLFVSGKWSDHELKKLNALSGTGMAGAVRRFLTRKKR